MVHCPTILAATLIHVALAWGPAGHAVVAQLCQDRLDDETQDVIDGIMGEGVPIASYSDWADQITHRGEAYNWKWSVPLHFADTPDCRFNYARDCKNDVCVAGGLKNYSRRVVDESLPLEQRQEALKFIVHFVGDAHQPLHAGHTKDKGGSTIKVKLGFARRERTTLHNTWDTALLYEFQSRGQPSPGEPYWTVTEKAVSEELEEGRRYADDIEEWIEDCEKYGLDACIEKWVDETAKAACDYSYKHVDGSLVMNNDVLPMEYYDDRIEVAKQQLAKGGIRLTWLLEYIFADHVTPSTRKLQS